MMRKLASKVVGAGAYCGADYGAHGGTREGSMVRDDPLYFK